MISGTAAKALAVWLGILGLAIVNGGLREAILIPVFGVPLIFEFAFGWLVQDKPWPELFQAYTFEGGNIWVVVLLITSVAPYISTRLRQGTRQRR